MFFDWSQFMVTWRPFFGRSLGHPLLGGYLVSLFWAVTWRPSLWTVTWRTCFGHSKNERKFQNHQKTICLGWDHFGVILVGSQYIECEQPCCLNVKDRINRFEMYFCVYAFTLEYSVSSCDYPKLILYSAVVGPFALHVGTFLLLFQ